MIALPRLHFVRNSKIISNQFDRQVLNRIWRRNCWIRPWNKMTGSTKRWWSNTMRWWIIRSFKKTWSLARSYQLTRRKRKYSMPSPQIRLFSYQATQVAVRQLRFDITYHVFHYNYKLTYPMCISGPSICPGLVSLLREGIPLQNLLYAASSNFGNHSRWACSLGTSAAFGRVSWLPDPIAKVKSLKFGRIHSNMICFQCPAAWARIHNVLYDGNTSKATGVRPTFERYITYFSWWSAWERREYRCGYGSSERGVYYGKII